MKKVYLILSLVIFPIFIIAQDIALEAFGPTFNNPVIITNAGDDRLFIVEQYGYIRILNPDGTTPSLPFLDIDARVIGIQNSWEAGLLGLAFHPDFATNGYFYVYYVDLNEDSVISRFSVDSNNSNLADPSSELIILKDPTVNAFTHFGGDLHFDSNGYLYIGIGDDGDSSGDSQNHSQNLSTLRGNILRIDIDNPDFGKNYGIPPDNPFANDGDPNTLGEIWSYGHRNPAKFSFDNVTGDMWISDPGKDEWEEIDLNIGNVGGINLGWPCFEGNTAFTNSVPVTCPDINTLTFPVSVYNHFEPDGIFRCAVIGGYRYRGSAQPNLYGTYFFADWCSNEIFMLTENAGTWTRTAYMPTIPDQNWTCFGEDTSGELYIIGNLGPGGFNESNVYKIKQNTLSNNVIDSKLEFNLIPNPTSNGKISLNFSNTISLKEINTYNLHGQKMKVSLSNLNSRTINLEFKELSAGIYIIEAISTSGERSVNKLIIK